MDKKEITQTLIRYLLCFPSLLVVKDFIEVDEPLAQELVHANQGAVHHYEAKLVHLRVPLQQQPRQLKGGFFPPDGLQCFL